MPKDDEAGMPNASIQMDLLTESGYCVTSVNYNNAYGWKEQNFDLPARAFDLVKELATIMHTVGEQKVQNVAALLEAPKEPEIVQS